MSVAGMLDIPDAVLSLGSNPSRDLILIKKNHTRNLILYPASQVVSFTRK